MLLQSVYLRNAKVHPFALCSVHDTEAATTDPVANRDL
jgi:hypothetical protein